MSATQLPAWKFVPTRPPAVQANCIEMSLKREGAVHRPNAEVLPEVASIVAEFSRSLKTLRLREMYKELAAADKALVAATEQCEALDKQQSAAAIAGKDALDKFQTDLAAANHDWETKRAEWEALKTGCSDLLVTLFAEWEKLERDARLRIADEAKEARHALLGEIETAISPLMTRLAETSERWMAASRLKLAPLVSIVGEQPRLLAAGEPKAAPVAQQQSVPCGGTLAPASFAGAR